MLAGATFKTNKIPSQSSIAQEEHTAAEEGRGVILAQESGEMMVMYLKWIFTGVSLASGSRGQIGREWVCMCWESMCQVCKDLSNSVCSNGRARLHPKALCQY